MHHQKAWETQSRTCISLTEVKSRCYRVNQFQGKVVNLSSVNLATSAVWLSASEFEVSTTSPEIMINYLGNTKPVLMVFYNYSIFSYALQI